jgi:hypothetical protein
MPGCTTDDAHADLLDHALANNRVALLDLVDDDDEDALAADVASAAAATENQSKGAAFSPWMVFPGVTAGTTRTVAPSAMVAGIISRNDQSRSPNEPSAGELGQSRYAIGLSQPAWSNAVREEMNTAGINVIRYMQNGYRVYGYRSLADPVSNWGWINFANCRLAMAIISEADVISESYVLRQIDGRGLIISSYGGALTAVLKRFYEEGSLYGASADEAFVVDVGSQVNTPETLSSQELHAVLAVRMSPFAELVELEIVNIPITEEVA